MTKFWSVILPCAVLAALSCTKGGHHEVNKSVDPISPLPPPNDDENLKITSRFTINDIQGVWWEDPVKDPSARFAVEGDSIFYVDSFKSLLVFVENDSLGIQYPSGESFKFYIKWIRNDSMCIEGYSDDEYLVRVK